MGDRPDKTKYWSTIGGARTKGGPSADIRLFMQHFVCWDKKNIRHIRDNCKRMN